VNQSPITILAIESGVAGGSFTLLAPEREVISLGGSSELSRAESVLSDLEKALKDNDLTINDIDHVAVSAGPGSFTGIRIGIATALGLGAALNVRVSSHSILLAMASASETSLQNRDTVSLIPMGRGSIALQRFKNEGGKIMEDSEILIMPFVEGCRPFVVGGQDLVLHSSIEAAISELARDETTIQSISQLSYPLAQYAKVDPCQQIEPLFISRQM
jgi:tRNA threonylcarbamoyl adenosine modification protein YeaZ